MAKSVDDRGRGARLARRDEGAYCWYVTEEQRSPPGCIGREGDRLSHSRALSIEPLTDRAGKLDSAQRSADISGFLAVFQSAIVRAADAFACDAAGFVSASVGQVLQQHRSAHQQGE